MKSTSRAGTGCWTLRKHSGKSSMAIGIFPSSFQRLPPPSQFPALSSQVQNALHGQKVRITDDDEPDCYYIGRLAVSEWKAERTIGKLTMDCNCEPFKYRPASQAVYLCGENLLNLTTGTATTASAWTMTETGYTFARGTVTGGSFIYFSVPVKKGQKYVFSAAYEMTGTMLYVYKKRLYGETVAKANKGSPIVFTADETGQYVFGLYATSAIQEGTFENVMLLEGESAATAYIPYDAGEKTVTATFANVRKPAVPTAFLKGSATVENESNFITLTPGANTLTEFVFYADETELTFKGNGIVMVEWLERGL